MRPFRVALRLASLTVLQIVALARLIVTKMTAAAVTFPTPDPPLADITTAANDLETANQDVASAKTALANKVTIQKQKRKVLADKLTSQGRYVDNRAAGDKAIIESAGMTASDEANPVHLEQVDDLSLTRGDNRGSVDAHWHAIEQAGGYRIEISHTAPDNLGNAPWEFYDNSGKSSATISGQTSGSGLWVHVCATGSGNNKGGFSDPAFLIVP